ncbi:MAG TPA: S8 family serine peptidase [Thermoanaerobaculia bacterium]|jgi:outer membrane protein assembly factor BamB|nr:S8 family serine peptidase [Thermoanaerobaculia bacterium]
MNRTFLFLALAIFTLSRDAFAQASTAQGDAVPNSIRLLAGTFDPKSDVKTEGAEFLPAIPKFVTPSGARFYLVQFKGPILPEWQEKVRATGATLVKYVPDFSFIVRMTPPQADAVTQMLFVRFVGTYKPVWRVEPTLLQQATSGGLGPNPALVLTAQKGESIDPVVAALRKKFPDLVIVKADSARREVAIVRVSAANVLALLQLALEHEVVAWIEIWREPTLGNNHSVWKGQSDDRTNGPTEAGAAQPREYPLSATIWARDILGTGQIVAVADSGLRHTSEFYRNNNIAAPWGNVAHQFVAAPGVITVDNTQRKVIAYNVLPGAADNDHSQCSFHGTHVSGSVAGDDISNPSTPTSAAYNAADGMAPQTKLIFQDIGTISGVNCSLAGIPADYRDLFTQARNAGAHIHSNSWGSAIGPYGAGEQQLDDFAFTNEALLIDFSAGNDDPGMTMVGSPCLAKNTMCIGALTHGSAQSDGVPTWSNEGWTLDGRYKPDISAPGENIVSAGGLSDTATATLSGTSMATPTASGYAALARQYFTEGWYPTGLKVPANARTPSSSLLKAALISGTRPVPNHSAEFVGAPCGNPCQDAGWGRITLDDSLYFSGDVLRLRAWDIATAAGAETSLIQEYEVENVAAGTRLNIILAWADAPGALGAATALTNDLNLEVVGPGGTIYHGNQWTGPGANGTKKASTPGAAAWDTLNNVEGVQIAAPAAGNYRVRVHGFNVPGDGTQTRQGYAIAATGALNTTCSLAAPTGLNATPNGANRIDLSWSAVPGATRYAIYRSVRGAANCSGAMQQIGQSATTTFSDLTVQGGYQYSYHVKTLAPCDGPASNCATATATGNCTLPPTFAGLTAATNAGTASCGVNLTWAAATSNCPAAPTVSYNVHRSTTPSFTPSAGNRIATCVSGTSYLDGGLTSGTTYYYVVRAEDGTTVNGGPCNGGNQETNSVIRSATPYGTGTTVGTWTDGGGDTTGQMIRGGTWSIVSTADDPAYVRTGTYAYKSSPSTTNYPSNACSDIRTPTLSVGAANPVVTFWARREIEFAFDGLVVEYSTNGGGAWTVVNTFTTGGYAGRTFTNAGNACGYATSQGCFQSTADPPPALPVYAQHTFTATAAISANFVVRWRLSTDSAVEYRGFMLDDVSITNISVPNACTSCTTPGVPTGLGVTTPANNTIRATWSAGSPAGATYNVYRANGACPGGAFSLLTSGIAGLTYDDTTVAGGSAYSYKVAAVDGTGSCISAQSSCASTTATGGPGLYSRGKTGSARPENTTSATSPTRWIYNTGAAALAPPGVGSVYAVSNDRVLHGLAGGDAGGGMWPSLWKPWLANAPSQARPAVPSLPIGSSTKEVFLGAQDGNVYAIDANNAALIWRTASPLGDMVQGAVNGLFSAYGGAFNLLVAGTRNSSAPNAVYALNPNTGATLWLFNNGGGASGIGIVAGDPWIDYGSVNPPKNKVYFTSRALTGGSSGTVWCLDITGATANLCSEPGATWPRAIGDIDGSPTLVGNRLYVGTNNGWVYCLNAMTGATIWSTSLDDGPVKGFISPDWTDNSLPYKLFVATSGTITALVDDTSTVFTEWNRFIAGPSVPLFTGSALYIGSSDGKLYELTNLNTFAVTKSVTLGSGANAVGSPSYDFMNNLVYVGTDAGKLYAVKVPLP